MMNFRRFLAATVTVSLVAAYSNPMVSYADQGSFNDIDEKNPFYHEIMTLTKEGVIKGYPDGTFKPNQPLTRSQIAKLFVRALHLEIPTNAHEWSSSFTDVKQGTDLAGELAALVKAGILTNDSSLFKQNAPLTRDEMASWLVRAFELKADDSIPVTLTDLKQIDPIHVENVKVLYQNSITTGKADGSYGPLDTVNRGQFAAFMYRSIYQIQSIQNPNAIVLDISKTVTLPDTLDVIYKNGKAGKAKISWNADQYDLSIPGTYNLVGSIVGSSKKAYLSIKMELQPLTITSVKGINLKQIEVEFNHTRGSIVENQSYYTLVNSDNEKIRIIDSEIRGNKLLLTSEKPLGNNDKLFLRVHKDLLGSEIVNEVITIDQTVPTVTNIETVSKSQLKLSFSEIMDFNTANGNKVANPSILSAFELNDPNNSIQSITVLNHGKEALIEYNYPIKEGNYSFKIKDLFRDFANYKLGNDSHSITMKYDTVPPAISTIKDIYANQYTIVFNKPIVLNQKTNIESNFRHNSQGTIAKIIQDSPTELIVILNQKGNFTETSKIIIDPKTISDLWGNNNLLLEHQIQVPNDKKGPEISKIEMLPEGQTSSSYIQLVVTYNEPVRTTEATEISSYALLDEKEKHVSIKRIEKETNNLTDRVYIMTLDTKYGDLQDGSYTLQTKNIKDLFQNETVKNTFSFITGSERKPGHFNSNILIDQDDIKFIIDFNEQMATSGVYTILDLAKYELKVGNSSVLLQTLEEDKNVNVTVRALDNGSKAEVVISPSSITAANHPILSELKSTVLKNELNKVQLSVAMVADADGNRTESISNMIGLTYKPTFTLASGGAEAIDTRTVKISFNEQLSNINATDFIVFYDKNKNGKLDTDEYLSIKGISNSSQATSSVITIDLGNELEYDSTVQNIPIYITTSEKTSTTNQFGQKVQIVTTKIVDKIAPHLELKDKQKNISIKASPDKGKGIVQLNFTENIDPSTVSRLSFTVANGIYSVEKAEVVNRNILLTVNLNGESLSKLVGENVKQVSPITDLQNNMVNDIEGLIQGN
jgi:hypothetical protein